MNVLEKAEKALEYLKNNEGVAKGHELQAAAGTLGRCLGALGSRQNYSRHYANLLHTAIPTLLTLASNESAEVRLLGDEALNRAVAGGFAFHSYKTNILLQNQIDATKNARWIRAALSRICLGDCWLRPGIGRIRSQAQTLFPKLSQIVRTSEIHLIVEALEQNLPRILNALAEYTTDEEICELSKALLTHIEHSEPAIRRGISTCVAHICAHRELLLTNVLTRAYERLWPLSQEDNVVIGWFCVIKAIFQINDINKFKENDLFSVQDYLELYQLTINYIEQSTEHNTQNTLLECLSVLLSLAKDEYRSALLEKHPRTICLDERQSGKGHRRNISYSSAISSVTIPSVALDAREPELRFSGALQLGSAVRISSLAASTDDLPIQVLPILQETPDSPVSDTDFHPDDEQLTRELTDRLRDYEEGGSDVITGDNDIKVRYEINIGSSADDDVRLRYCVRLLASKFLLTGNKGGLISDRIVRVSVKSSALSCVALVAALYPQAMTLCLDKDEDLRFQNYSGTSEGTDANPDHMNEYILERNVCYQDSITESLSQELLNLNSESQVFKKDSLEKSVDSEPRSSKDIHSTIPDGRTAHLAASGLSADGTAPNMTASNFTTHSNMTTSTDRASTGYPTSTSEDVASSSIDLDMKFDHFGDCTAASDDVAQERTVIAREARGGREGREGREADEPAPGADCAHVWDILPALQQHADPALRGLARLCAGRYLAAALRGAPGGGEAGGGGAQDLSVDNLTELILKGVRDEVHSTVTHSVCALAPVCSWLCRPAHWRLLARALAALSTVRHNAYWLCRLHLARFYETLPYERMFTLDPEYYSTSKLIMEVLFHLCADRDQRVRTAAAHTIASITPKIYPTRKSTPISVMTEIFKEQSKLFTFDTNKLSLDLVRDIYFYNDLPEQFKHGASVTNRDSLAIIIMEVMGRLMASNCKHNTQGLIETLQAICTKWSPWRQPEAFLEQGVLSYCVDCLQHCDGSVLLRTMLLDVCRLVYPAEIHNVMCHKTENRNIFERDTQVKEKWQHLNTNTDDNTGSTTSDNKVANIAEKFQHVTLKMLNVLVHLIEEVNPNIHLTKSGIALPGSPVRRKTQESLPRKSSLTEEDRKKRPMPATNLKANFSGHFFNEPFYMKLYENLRATYSNHKINLDPKSSIFHTFLSTTLDCLSVQLELATEKEFGPVTEEILFYLKVIMPLCPNKAVGCITQLLKCLFGTNMVNQYGDYMSIADKVPQDSTGFYESVLLTTLADDDESSVSSNSSQLDSKNPRMLEEKRMLMNMENFSKNRSDRKWSNNKKELERYILLFEPVVIQSLKTYTMQSDVPLQCCVLSLLCALLSLRVNYCMLDRDQVFIGFLMKQLDYVEQHEIPNCCELVYSIMNFLVQLSSSKHHTKQIIEIPKLLQLCDGLLAAGAQDQCVSGLTPVAARVFSNMGGGSILGRAQQQEAQATKEVLFYMLQKTMHLPQVLELVSGVLSLSQEHPESYYRWSELAADSLLNLLTERTVGDTRRSVQAVEMMMDCVYRDVLLEQSRVEVVLKILFKSPPERETSSKKLKIKYLTTIMILLRKVLVLIPETEILLSINYLKSTCISPQSIFFNVKQNIDPLNVQNVNENCANLSPDVILVRFLFKTLTYAILEMDGFEANLDFDDMEDGDQNELLYAACVNIIVQAKNILHLTPGCLFPLTAKTAQSILHNEQSGLNTGLYSPDENIPLRRLNSTGLRLARARPLLTAHWAHLLVRLNFLPPSYWRQLVAPPGDGGEVSVRVDVLRVACVLAYCEYFMVNGLCSGVQVSRVLVDGVQVVVSQRLLQLLQPPAPAAAHALLLAAVAARCRRGLADEFALNTYKILSQIHESQSGALVVLICRIIGKLEPALAIRFAKLAVQRCNMLREMPSDVINTQLSKEDVQGALELLQRDKIHIRHPSLVCALNALACSALDLSPLERSQRRAVSAECAQTTDTQRAWLLHQLRNRCCQSDSSEPKVSKYKDLANLLINLSLEDLTTIMSCSEFDRKILSSCFKISCEHFTREFLNVISVQELRETEIESIKEQREAKLKEEMASSVDSNKLNVVNTIHVFKKSDNKESKSQFFIPIVDNDVTEKFGNLEISEEDSDIVIPEVPKLYQASLTTLDKSLADVLKMFPKQNRPLSQSENFNLNIDHTIDRYTRRCHQVFQDKLFYKEFMTIQTALTGFLIAVDKILILIDETDCDLLEKCIDNIIPSSVARNIAMFSVVSLQYLSFLIKNKKLVETPFDPDVSFGATNLGTDNVCVDHVIVVTIHNVAKAFNFSEIWSELNAENYLNKTQSAISCLYAIVKYLVKDTRPIILKSHIPFQDPGPKPDIIITGNKLVSLIDYWEENFYTNSNRQILGKRYRRPLESLLISLSRLEVVTNIALIPPIAWSYVEVKLKNEKLEKVDIPLQPLQDMDVLEAFLFRVNLVGWSTKKQFEEVWVGLLGALQGNGTHWAVLGLTQLLLSTAAAVRGRPAHVPRLHAPLTDGMQRLRNILIGTSASSIFTDVNLERIPLINDGFEGYHQGQFSAEYLKLASDISTEASHKVRKAVKRKRKNREIDVNSCIQLLMDITTDMLDPKSSTGVAGRLYLIKSLEHVGGVLSLATQWARAAKLLTRAPSTAAAAALLHALAGCLAVLQGDVQEASLVHERLLKSVWSPSAAVRQAALRGWLLQLAALPRDAPAALRDALRPTDTKISPHEQSLNWSVLFSLVQCGHVDLIHVAVDFLLTHPQHYCADLVVKGITSTLRQRVLPKELKKTIIEKLLDNMKSYSEHHAVQILMVHLFSADSKLISPRLESDVSNMDPDVLMNSMERITLLYKMLKQFKHAENKQICTSSLKYFLRETLPPAATLSRVVIEYLETCKETERHAVAVLSDRDTWIHCSVMNAEIVYEVFDTSVSQDQLPVLSGWIFEALCHLLSGKISSQLVPYCLLTLLVAASSNTHLRHLHPLTYCILRHGFHKNPKISLEESSKESPERLNEEEMNQNDERMDTSEDLVRGGDELDENWGIFGDLIQNVGMSFSDRRLLCVAALHSNFSTNQLDRLKELCEGNEYLSDLKRCLTN